MREIEFRGKEYRTGEWRYGDLVRYSERFSYIYGNYINGSEIWECLSETIGQYTGLKDKNGKRIFEGDIVLAWSAGVKAIGRVTQRIDGLWLIYPAWQNKRFYYFQPNGNGEDSVEIIGNIYDNPELLKEATL